MGEADDACGAVDLGCQRAAHHQVRQVLLRLQVKGSMGEAGPSASVQFQFHHQVPTTG